MVVMLLKTGEVHIWLLPCLQILPNTLLDFLPLEEIKRAETMNSVRRKNEWLASRALLRACLSHYTANDSLALVFEKTEAGKPVLIKPISDYVFNLSHGPRWIACAVARAQCIGIDIDSESRRNRTDDISKYYFHSAEQKVLQGLPDEVQRKRQFFRYWTLKEAYIKARGTTISSSRLHEMGFALREKENPEPLFDLPEGKWSFKQWRFDHDHHFSLACRWSACDTGADTTKLQYHFWQWHPETNQRTNFVMNES